MAPADDHATKLSKADDQASFRDCGWSVPCPLGASNKEEIAARENIRVLVGGDFVVNPVYGVSCKRETAWMPLCVSVPGGTGRS
ncbi:hypothetical protein [Alicyclobacillus fastidiosus]|uniref:Uncharacterized protein n=1 Tax=Alicyclobacillus fastidiosus TaxID=392011 RepID=A0ABV5AHT7_9BACL|nr:hypothetical protein [Alicyclobacillus fastidiosus]WEH07938.1 hypothetical protein PYS47_14370 [Alicyclobacillus fastidiosus]